MIEIGKIISSRIGKNRDASQTTQLHQVQLNEKEDVQEVDQLHLPGVQYNPPVNSTSFIARVSAAFKFIVGINDNIPKLTNLNPGERQAYGSKAGAIVCSLWYKDDGTIQIDTDKDLIANVTGVVTITAPTVNIVGNLNVTGKIEATEDIEADSDGIPISLLQHPHLGNLGYNTGVPLAIAGGVAPPTNPPHSDSTGDLITGDNGNSLDTLQTDYDAHVHTYTWTGSPGSGSTSTPV